MKVQLLLLVAFAACLATSQQVNFKVNAPSEGDFDEPTQEQNPLNNPDDSGIIKSVVDTEEPCICVPYYQCSKKR